MHVLCVKENVYIVCGRKGETTDKETNAEGKNEQSSAQVYLRPWILS